MYKYQYTCFNCNKVIITEKCPHCGYEYSEKLECPRKRGIKCVHTNKMCTNINYEECKVLRAND